MKDRSFGHNIPPTEFNQFLLDAIDIIIDRIAEKYTFPKMLQDINGAKHLIDLDKPGIEYVAPSFNGHFKEWLEYNFVSIFRANTRGCVPPIYVWRLGFSAIQFQLTKKAATELFIQDLDWAKHSLIQQHLKEYPYVYNCPLYYNLSEEKFMNYV